MSTVVFLEHALQERLGLPCQAYALAERWTANGHRVLYHRGLDTPPPGDVAILHVDLGIGCEAPAESETTLR